MNPETTAEPDFRFASEAKKPPNPLLGERETTLTYRFEPTPRGTLVTVREDGFRGRPAAAFGNAENWEKVLSWLDEYVSRKYA